MMRGHGHRWLGAALGLFLGLWLAADLGRWMSAGLGLAPVDVALGEAAAGVVGAGTGLAVAGRLWRAGRRWSTSLMDRLSRLSAQAALTGGIGLLFGLAAAALLGGALAELPEVGRVLPLLASLTLGYTGLVAGLSLEGEFAAVERWVRPKAGRGAIPKVLDTSVIIDGRIADLCRTGFLEGPLVVPSFVLEELRHIADSSDALKRNRGRRGLDILNQIQRDLKVPVKVHERAGSDPLAEVDTKLLRLARELGGKILTNDFNLNKVAELQGVEVLNINELANAVKPVVLPGEEMVVRVIKDGKEAGQGVAYLDDGTMIVVDGGKKYIGDSVGVLVTSVLQTAAGRMIFAKPKPAEQSASVQ
jgi:uncharacterized protein YacL